MRPFVFDGPILRRPNLGHILHIRREYRKVFGRYPNLLRPSRFTEKIQWRKLFDRNPIFAVLSDKIATRDFIAARVGAKFLTPLLWVGDRPEDIPVAALEPPYVVKCSHSSGLNVLVTAHQEVDWDKARSWLRQGLARNHGLVECEPGYQPVRPRLLAERLLLQPDGAPPLEHKMFVFDGRVRLIHTIVVAHDRKRYDAVYDPEWNWLGWRTINPRHEDMLPRPERLKELIAVAERLGTGLDHVRVDTYGWAGGVRVGELTLYNLSGLVPFKPDEADFTMGSFWRLERPVLRALESLLRR